MTSIHGTFLNVSITLQHSLMLYVGFQGLSFTFIDVIVGCLEKFFKKFLYILCHIVLFIKVYVSLWRYKGLYHITTLSRCYSVWLVYVKTTKGMMFQSITRRNNGRTLNWCIKNLMWLPTTWAFFSGCVHILVYVNTTKDVTH